MLFNKKTHLTMSDEKLEVIPQEAKGGMVVSAASE
jgi:hypothetical protein